LARGAFQQNRSSSGRFLPPDPRVAEPYRFTPQLALRVGMLGALAVAVFAILFLRLWALQVLSGDRYLSAAQNNQIRTLRVEAPRGPILDRNGNVLVSNVPGTAVQIWVSDLPSEGRYDLVRRLSKILRVPVPKLAAAIDDQRTDPLTPITVKTAVHEDQVATILERQREFPGVRVVQTYLRDYEYQALGAQFLGYVGEISAEELAAKEGYNLGDKIGKSGIEASFDQYLKGTAGAAQITVDSLGRPQSELTLRKEARTGNGVRLTIDVQLQRAAEQALRFGIQTAINGGAWNADGGAVVVMDPRDGAVLALASNPTYKPSIYVGRVDPKKLEPLVVESVARKYNYPGLNRAIAGLYPPGSVWKPITAIAAMEENLLSPYDLIQCDPIAYYGRDKQAFKNWNPFTNKPMTLPVALAESCDTYFYTVGNRFYEEGARGRTRMQEWAQRFGFGQSPGLDIGGDAAGLLPTPEWRKQTYATAIDKAWNPGDSIQLAIGQKDLQVTPLQMTRFYAALANGGNLVTPYLVSAVEQPGNNGRPSATLRTFAPDPPRPITLDPEALQAVKDGLYMATHAADGTSSGVFGAYPVPIAGKTGTAEKVVPLPGYPAAHMEDQAWWCGWGPFDGTSYRGKPPIAVCVLIENGGHGGTAAAPAAMKVFEAYFGEKAGAQGVVATD
jgi:penicillin-binding protein 2